jgi:hypothetical protein
VCLPMRDDRAGFKRNLMRIRGRESDLEAIFFNPVPAQNETQLLACNREGTQLEKTSFPQIHKLGATTKFVDVNGNGKPDLVQILAGKVRIYKNESTSEEFIFHPHPFSNFCTRANWKRRLLAQSIQPHFLCRI